MTSKEKFIKLVQENIFDNAEKFESNEDWQEITDFWQAFCLSKKETSKLTESGIKILLFMQENEKVYNNVFKAKDIAEGLFISSRSASGSMQKLIKEGFCEKIGGSPVCYKLTDDGRNEDIKSFILK